MGWPGIFKHHGNTWATTKLTKFKMYTQLHFVLSSLLIISRLGFGLQNAESHSSRRRRRWQQQKYKNVKWYWKYRILVHEWMQSASASGQNQKYCNKTGIALNGTNIYNRMPAMTSHIALPFTECYKICDEHTSTRCTLYSLGIVYTWRACLIPLLSFRSK